MKKTIFVIWAITQFLLSYASPEDMVVRKRELGGIEYYKITQGDYAGCMDMDKNIIIPLSRKYTNAYPRKQKESYPLTYSVYRGDNAGVCDASGKEIISPDRGYTTVVYYEPGSQYPGIKYFYVESKDGNGICDLSGKEIVAPKYASVIYGNAGFMVQATASGGYEETGIVLTENDFASANEIETPVQTKPDIALEEMPVSSGNEDSKGQIAEEKRELGGIEYYRITQDGYEGCMDMNRNVVIPLSRKYTEAYPQKLKEHHPLTYIVYRGDYAGVCDASGKEIISPDRGYSIVFYMDCEDDYPGVKYFYVESKDGHGICDMSGREIVAPKYDVVIYSSNGILAQSKETGEFEETGIILNEKGLVSADAIIREKRQEDDGFTWYKTYKNGVYGAETIDGKTLIALSRGYTDVYYWTRKDGKKGYFECNKGDKEGICTIDGTEIIKPKYSGVFYSERSGFEIKKDELGSYEESNIFLGDNGLVKKAVEQNHSYVAQNTSTVNSNTSNVAHSHNHASASTSHRAQQPQQQRIQTANGYIDYIPQGNGTVMMVTHQVCFMCKGTGMCSLCGGQGGIVHPYLGTYINCTNCSMSGRCKYCNGTGEQVFNSVVDGAGNGYSVDMNGNVVTTGGSGGSGSSSSSSSNSSSSGSSGNDYIETIEYSPNYTGQDNSEWCDICKEIKPAHKHIKKRY